MCVSIYQPMADVTSSAISAFVVRTVNCIVTPSARANFARSNTSCPPRKTPEMKTNKN